MEQAPSWPEKHFAWRNVVFTKDDDVRYILDVADPETVNAAIDIGEPFLPGTNVIIIKGAHPGSEKVYLHDAELLDLIQREGWYERPPPPGAKSGFWDGKGNWSEDPEEWAALPPDMEEPIIEGRRMKTTKKKLRKMIQESMGAAMGRGAPMPMRSRATPEFAQQVKGTQIKEYSDYASHDDLSDSLDDIGDMLNDVLAKYVDNGWLEANSEETVGEDISNFLADASAALDRASFELSALTGRKR